jgi:hypothetical protein
MVWAWVGTVVFVFPSMAVPALALGQVQAANGNVEGTVRDGSRAVLPGATVTVINTDTSTSRVVVSNEQGVDRALLLPLGAYTVTAEL